MSESQISNHPKITLSLVADLVAQQFPQWAQLPIRPVKLGGRDNRTFHLGNDMSIRLPSAATYAAQVSIEQEWLPKLAPRLPCPIPTPLALGVPSENYPWNWSIYRLIEGNNADVLQESDLSQFAADSARFLNELYRIDTYGGPVAGPDNFYRGASLGVYDAETRTALSRLENIVDIDAVTDVWRQALSTVWRNDPVWIHGDFSSGNILVKDGKLAGVIDFGCMGVGDPACDLVIAWTFLTGENRKIF